MITKIPKCVLLILIQLIKKQTIEYVGFLFLIEVGIKIFKVV